MATTGAGFFMVGGAGATRAVVGVSVAVVTGVCVGDTAVFVAVGTRVFVGGTGVAVSAGVSVGVTGVSIGIGVTVGGTGVSVGIGVGKSVNITSRFRFDTPLS